MKALIIILGVTLGTFLGFYPSLFKPKPTWWKVLLISSVTLTIIFGLLPPIAGNFADAYYLNAKGINKAINVKISTNNLTSTFDEKNNNWIIKDQVSAEDSPNFIIVDNIKLPTEFKTKNSDIVIKTKFNKSKNAFMYYSTEYINPLLTLPYVLDLEERIKILNFHVPMAWIGVLAYLLSMIYSIQYLRKKDLHYDTIASTSASLGTIFTILATVTGMIWAKFNWGTYWNWDPRQTSIFILLLIYFAYFALRSAIDNEEMKAKLSSVYAILAFVTVPFFVFVLPRITSGLHPGSADDDNLGPILSGGSNMLNINKQFIFGLALASFTMLFFWLLNLVLREKKLKETIEDL